MVRNDYNEPIAMDPITTTNGNETNHHNIDYQRSYSIATGAQTLSNKSSHGSRPQSRHSFSSDTQVLKSKNKNFN